MPMHTACLEVARTGRNPWVPAWRSSRSQRPWAPSVAGEGQASNAWHEPCAWQLQNLRGHNQFLAGAKPFGRSGLDQWMPTCCSSSARAGISTKRLKAHARACRAGWWGMLEGSGRSHRQPHRKTRVPAPPKKADKNHPALAVKPTGTALQLAHGCTSPARGRVPPPAPLSTRFGVPSPETVRGAAMSPDPATCGGWE